MKARYPLSLGDVSPGEGFWRMTLTCSWKGLPEGRHTGGPWTSGKEVWKPLDACPGPDVPYRVNTLEDVVLAELHAVDSFLFPKNWRVEECRGRRFLVRPWFRVVPFSYQSAQITRDQVLLVERMVRVVNEQWWWIGDDLNIAFDADDHPILLDLSGAQRVNSRVAQGCEQPAEEYRFQEWAEAVAGHSELVRLRRAAQHLVSSIRWTMSEDALGWTNPRQWVYASSFQPVAEMDQCIVFPAHIEDLHVRFWCVAPGPLTDAVLNNYNLVLGWAPLQYKSF